MVFIINLTNRQARSAGFTTITLSVCKSLSIICQVILLDLKELTSIVLDYQIACRSRDWRFREGHMISEIDQLVILGMIHSS